MSFDITEVIFVRSDFFPSGVWVYGYLDGHLTGTFYTDGCLSEDVFDFIYGKVPYEYTDGRILYVCYYAWSERRDRFKE